MLLFPDADEAARPGGAQGEFGSSVQWDKISPIVRGAGMQQGRISNAYRKELLAAILVIAGAVVVLWAADRSAKSHRFLPPDAAVTVASTQADVYGIYRALGLRGVTVVHFNRDMNMLEYLPKEESETTSVPVRIGDSVPLYEKGLNSHNWLFIASRTGIVRRVFIVLPSQELRLRIEGLKGGYHPHGQTGYAGYEYDTPVVVTSLFGMPSVDEPVVLDIDAGFFMEGISENYVLEAVRSRFRNIRLIVGVRSVDEPDIPATARASLESMLKHAGWQ